MKAVVSPGPPKAMLVVSGSPVGTNSIDAPSGEMIVMPPFTIVATQTLPSASTASESSSCRPGRPASRWPPLGESALARICPGPSSSHYKTRPVWVSAT